MSPKVTQYSNKLFTALKRGNRRYDWNVAYA